MNTDLPKSWHQEISAELAAARSELPALQAQDTAAAEAVRAAELVLNVAHAAVAAIERPSPHITSRLAEFVTARNSARGNQRRAMGCLRSARERIRELESALAQLDQVINPTAEGAA